ncbi:hypothetical protein RKD37_000196 [Streptomyces ambofaciens]|jgi:hypothetical protein
MRNSGDTMSMMRPVSGNQRLGWERSDSQGFGSCRLVVTKDQVKHSLELKQRLKRLKLSMYHAHAHLSIAHICRARVA